MRRSISISVFIMAMFHVFPCYGEEKPSEIRFNYLTSPNNNSALSGRCTGDTSSYEIECKFWQVRVRLALDPDELQEKLEEFIYETRMNLDYLEDRNNWISYDYWCRLLAKLVEYTGNRKAPFEAGTYTTKKECFGSLETFYSNNSKKQIYISNTSFISLYCSHSH